MRGFSIEYLPKPGRLVSAVVIELNFWPARGGSGGFACVTCGSRNSDRSEYLRLETGKVEERFVQCIRPEGCWRRSGRRMRR